MPNFLRSDTSGKWVGEHAWKMAKAHTKLLTSVARSILIR